MDTRDHAEFAGRLSEAIKNSGLSILSIAGSTGVSDSTIHLWLKGSEPSRRKLVALAEATNVSLDWLAAGRGQMKPHEPAGFVVPRCPIEPPPIAIERGWLNRILQHSYCPPILIEVSDDSMEPTMRQGDLLLGSGTLDLLPGLETLGGTNGIYLCARTRAQPGEQILVNWVGDGEVGLRPVRVGEDVEAKFLFDKDGKLVNRIFPRRVEWTSKPSAIVKCDNEAYPVEVEWTPQDGHGIGIIGRVAWHFRPI